MTVHSALVLVDALVLQHQLQRGPAEDGAAEDEYLEEADDEDESLLPLGQRRRHAASDEGIVVNAGGGAVGALPPRCSANIEVCLYKHEHGTERVMKTSC